MAESSNIVWHASLATPEERARVTCVRPTILWFTGLSGSGKSTVAVALEKHLIGQGHGAYVLDGDNVRHGLNKNLSFSPADRTENIRRIGEVAKLFADASLVAITSFISPYRADRDLVRSLVPAGVFVEVFVDAPLEVCEARDPKSLYKKARAAVASGQGMMFTGIDAPYEPPLRPEIHLRTAEESVETCVRKIVAYLREQGKIVDGAIERRV